MRLRLATKISAATVGVIALAIFSSVVALFSSWHLANLLDRTVSENLECVRAAEELEISLLEQRGFVSSYLLDRGSPSSLEGLELRKQSFFDWLGRARASADSAEQTQTLRDLEEVYRRYDAKRNAVLALYDDGRHEEARATFLRDVNKLYRDAYDLCEDFLAANEEYVDSRMAEARQRTTRVTWTVAICVGSTVALGVALLWLFFNGILLPLRHMAADARVFAGENPAATADMPADDLRAVGVFLQALISDVADTRSTLADSRTRLANAEKLASVGKLAASVAHEMRNPLTAVKMWLFSIRKTLDTNPEVQRKLDIVSEEISRLESIIRNFLEFSRPPALKQQPLHVSTLIGKTLELFAHRIGEQRIHLLRDDADELPLVMADPEQLKQVLINLLDNAAEAAGEGGEIRVSTRNGADPDGRPMLVVRIRDGGPGMSPAVRQRIFEPFFTTKDDGTGLGLCIAARIVAQHHGRLVLESYSQGNTTFAVWIPTLPRNKHEPHPDR